MRSASPSAGSTSRPGVGTADDGGDAGDSPDDDDDAAGSGCGPNVAVDELPLDLGVRRRSCFSTSGSESTEPDDHTLATAGGAGMPNEGIPVEFDGEDICMGNDEQGL